LGHFIFWIVGTRGEQQEFLGFIPSALFSSASYGRFLSMEAHARAETSSRDIAADLCSDQLA
jgi:hypothetical protein